MITPDVVALKDKIAQFETALLGRSPDIRTLLHTIHSNLKQDAELVTLLSEDEIKIIVKGLMEVQQTEIMFSAVKSSAGKKSLKNLDLDTDI